MQNAIVIKDVEDLTVELFEIIGAGVFVAFQRYSLLRYSLLSDPLRLSLSLFGLAVGYLVKRLVRLTESLLLLSLAQRLVGSLSSAVVNIDVVQMAAQNFSCLMCPFERHYHQP